MKEKYDDPSYGWQTKEGKATDVHMGPFGSHGAFQTVVVGGGEGLLGILEKRRFLCLMA